MAKKTTSPGINHAGDVNGFRWPTPGKASGQHWSFDQTNGIEIDISGGVGKRFAEEFATGRGEFRVYFDSLLAQAQARAFFALALFSFVELSYPRPVFEEVFLEFTGQFDREVVIGVIDGLVYMYFEVDVGQQIGIVMQLHHPADI